MLKQTATVIALASLAFGIPGPPDTSQLKLRRPQLESSEFGIVPHITASWVVLIPDESIPKTFEEYRQVVRYWDKKNCDEPNDWPVDPKQVARCTNQL